MSDIMLHLVTTAHLCISASTRDLHAFNIAFTVTVIIINIKQVFRKEARDIYSRSRCGAVPLFRGASPL